MKPIGFHVLVLPPLPKELTFRMQQKIEELKNHIYSSKWTTLSSLVGECFRSLEKQQIVNILSEFMITYLHLCASNDSDSTMMLRALQNGKDMDSLSGFVEESQSLLNAEIRPPNLPGMSNYLRAFTHFLLLFNQHSRTDVFVATASRIPGMITMALAKFYWAEMHPDHWEEARSFRVTQQSYITGRISEAEQDWFTMQGVQEVYKQQWQIFVGLIEALE